MHSSYPQFDGVHFSQISWGKGVFDKSEIFFIKLFLCFEKLKKKEAEDLRIKNFS